MDARSAGLDAGPFGQPHRRLKTADVNLLAHHQFPQIAFRTAVDGLHVLQPDRRRSFHREAPEQTDDLPAAILNYALSDVNCRGTKKTVRDVPNVRALGAARNPGEPVILSAAKNLGESVDLG